MRNLIVFCSFLALSVLGRVEAGPLHKNSTSSIGFSLSARDLSGCDLITKCDTSVLIRYSSVYTDWIIHGKTRTIRNNNNPVWPETFEFEHEPGTSQRWRLDLREHGLFGSKVIATFMVIVDEYALMKEDLLIHEIPNNKGQLQMHRVAN